MAHARIRSVRFKDGSAEIRILRRPDFRAEAKAVTEKCFAAATHDIAGMAIVLWSADGASTATMRVGPGCMPTILVPDFVRNRLMAERIIGWAVDEVSS